MPAIRFEQPWHIYFPDDFDNETRTRLETEVRAILARHTSRLRSIKLTAFPSPSALVEPRMPDRQEMERLGVVLRSPLQAAIETVDIFGRAAPLSEGEVKAAYALVSTEPTPEAVTERLSRCRSGFTLDPGHAALPLFVQAAQKLLADNPFGLADTSWGRLVTTQEALSALPQSMPDTPGAEPDPYESLTQRDTRLLSVSPFSIYEVLGYFCAAYAWKDLTVELVGLSHTDASAKRADRRLERLTGLSGFSLAGKKIRFETELDGDTSHLASTVDALLLFSAAEPDLQLRFVDEDSTPFLTMKAGEVTPVAEAAPLHRMLRVARTARSWVRDLNASVDGPTAECERILKAFNDDPRPDLVAQIRGGRCWISQKGEVRQMVATGERTLERAAPGGVVPRGVSVQFSLMFDMGIQRVQYVSGGSPTQLRATLRRALRAPFHLDSRTFLGPQALAEILRGEELTLIHDAWFPAQEGFQTHLSAEGRVSIGIAPRPRRLISSWQRGDRHAHVSDVVWNTNERRYESELVLSSGDVHRRITSPVGFDVLGFLGDRLVVLTGGLVRRVVAYGLTPDEDGTLKLPGETVSDVELEASGERLWLAGGDEKSTELSGYGPALRRVCQQTIDGGLTRIEPLGQGLAIGAHTRKEEGDEGVTSVWQTSGAKEPRLVARLRGHAALVGHLGPLHVLLRVARGTMQRLVLVDGDGAITPISRGLRRPKGATMQFLKTFGEVVGVEVFLGGRQLRTYEVSATRARSLGSGVVQVLPSPGGVLAFSRERGGQTELVLRRPGVGRVVVPVDAPGILVWSARSVR